MFRATNDYLNNDSCRHLELLCHNELKHSTLKRGAQVSMILIYPYIYINSITVLFSISRWFWTPWKLIFSMINMTAFILRYWSSFFQLHMINAEHLTLLTLHCYVNLIKYYVDSMRSNGCCTLLNCVLISSGNSATGQYQNKYWNKC